MHWISWSQRLGDRILQLFGLKPSPEKIELEMLRARQRLEDERLLEEMRANLARKSGKDRSFESFFADLAAKDASDHGKAADPVVDRHIQKKAKATAP